jgi:hypothetical protein
MSGLTVADVAAMRESAAPTLDDIRGWPATVAVHPACRALGISTSWGYQLIAAGEFPCRVIPIRGRSRVVTASLIELLEGTSGAVDGA